MVDLISYFAAKQLADGLNLKNQETAADINAHLLRLTRETVDDSATIRAMTLVTLIYLPGSFVAVCTQKGLPFWKETD